jgi:circadian clock protein KaiB
MTLPYVLKLYIVGQTIRSRQAVANLQRICRERLDGRCDCTIIDVLEQPQLAEADRVIATPVLLKVSPPPARRLLGDLSDLDQVSQALGLHLEPTPSSHQGDKG